MSSVFFINFQKNKKSYDFPEPKINEEQKKNVKKSEKFFKFKKTKVCESYEKLEVKINRQAERIANYKNLVEK